MGSLLNKVLMAHGLGKACSATCCALIRKKQDTKEFIEGCFEISVLKFGMECGV